MVDAEGAQEAGASRGVSRRTIMKGAAWTVPALMVATSAPAYAASCEKGKWNALGRGKMLSGGLFGLDLDTLASVDGTIASAPSLVSETGFKHGPNGEGDPDAHANPLSVTALGGINITATGLTTTVSTILGILATADTGALNQFGYASSDGLSIGAAGYVADNGTVRVAPAGGYPEIAALNLQQFLTPLLGSATTGFLANITNLDLHVGALVGRAIFEQMCNTVDNPAGYKLHREYLVAYLRLALTSPLLGAVVSAVQGAVNNVNLAVDSDDLLDALGEIPVIGGVVTALIDAAAKPVVKVSANIGAIATALAGPIGTGTAIVTQLGGPGAGITVDVASLLGSAFPGGSSSMMANSLPANSILFVDYPLPTNTLEHQLAQLQDEIIALIASNVSVEISFSILFGVTTLKVSGTLADFLNGTATIVAKLAGVTIINGSVANVALKLVGDVVKGGLLVAGGPIDLATTAVNGLLGAVFDALKNLLNITLNVQNFPELNNDPATGRNNPHTGYNDPNGPHRWDATGSQPLPAGRYDVAALGISAVNLLSTLDLYLARGSVGPHTPKP